MCLEINRPVFTSLNFATIIFLQGKVISFASNPRRTKSLYLCPPRNRMPQLYPQAPGSVFVASYDSQNYGGGILTSLHTGWIKDILTNKVHLSSRTTFP
jgi:hypothetical protein